MGYRSFFRHSHSINSIRGDCLEVSWGLESKKTNCQSFSKGKKSFDERRLPPRVATNARGFP
jgi:hypothetical protein